MSSASPERWPGLTKRSAFSLPEVLLALAVLGLAMSFFTYFVDALKLTDAAKDEAAIAAYTYNYLENLRAEWQNTANFDVAYGLHEIALPPGFSAEIRTKEEKAQIQKKGLGAVTITALRTVSIRIKDKTAKLDDFEMTAQFVRPPGETNE